MSKVTYDEFYFPPINDNCKYTKKCHTKQKNYHTLVFLSYA